MDGYHTIKEIESISTKPLSEAQLLKMSLVEGQEISFNLEFQEEFIVGKEYEFKLDFPDETIIPFKAKCISHSYEGETTLQIV